MKFLSACTDLCSKQIFKNAATGCNSHCCSLVKSTSCELQFLLTVPAPVGSVWHSVTVTCISQEGVYNN
jgi:hypothetical protein